VLPRRVVAEQEPFFIASDGPKAHDIRRSGCVAPEAADASDAKGG
jgi:hypothetical protein